MHMLVSHVIENKISIWKCLSRRICIKQFIIGTTECFYSLCGLHMSLKLQAQARWRYNSDCCREEIVVAT